VKQMIKISRETGTPIITTSTEPGV